MPLWILDTDHVSLFLNGDQNVGRKVIQQLADTAITVVTVQELFNGWVGRINDPAQADQLILLYTKLWNTAEFLKTIRILNFDAAADACYKNLLRDKSLSQKRLQKDLRIAAIALSVNGIMVTRNHRDFSKVPNLRIEDWTV
ncbi:type II toxin-antitoxin system VapC family toxin [Pseudanabaenaceae cyanobacterium LEGE 13415]|nr:type II toxin-antitoxin system VapC family toxin [Pseudanabaenaceae cyanobacterium LEGE 13415]